ncbi:response regulator [Desulfolutivibrio sulfoxidireducens]|uniref:response regulator n=1 Tax=Desulfolutivibrio sulfoxidireducens TaxID=2773299 RepID=UPI00159E2797|nr:response regulator [Desulfolutivibrio sulfoxidireducens]QLA17721.1 response regulator [Desulfolutivibrio sulfoxidireducens]
MDDTAAELARLKAAQARLAAEHDAVVERLRVCEESARKKARFLSELSHDLRTPINGVLGMIQLALASKTCPEAREFLDMAQTSATTLLSLVNELLELSAVESGRLSLVEKLFDPRAEFEPMLRNFKTQSQWKNVEFTYRIDDLVPLRLIGDAARTKQVLVNLLGNSFANTKKGFISVAIGLWGGEGKGAGRPGTMLPPGRVALQFTVKDTGIGIDPSRQADLFEPYAPGADSLDMKHGRGSSLGLAVCKRLVAMMHGDIWLDSAEGRGSAFTFTVEYGLCDESRPRPAPPETVSVPVPPGNLRILLAEDEPVNRIFTVRALQRLGFTVLTAVDGKEALQVLSREPVDLVLMDIQMPRLNGLDATRAIRAGQVPGLDPGIPIVALTAFAMESDKMRGLEAGMDEYVTKPFEVPVLMDIIRRVLD